MYRYIALMCCRADLEAARAAKFLTAKLHEVSPHAWSPAWESADLAIYHSGEHKGRMQSYQLQGERGAVLGRLFRNDYTSVIDDLDEFESCKCLKTRGQHLIDNCWGRYVAFLNDPVTGTRYVMRDPSGAFPCFYTLFRGVTIYFSDMQDVARFDFLSFTVNWEYLKANIMLPMLQKRITGLNEVGEVLPAERVEVKALESRSGFVWNPTELSQTNVVEGGPEEASELLRETVKSTISTLAGCYDRIIHNLGGLDSSIALACMAQAHKRPEITCINFYTKSPRGDERRYSRQVAEKYEVDIVERELDHSKADLSKIYNANELASPPGFFDCIGLTGDVLNLAKERGAQALFYGVGGDNVYFQVPRNLGALDYVRSHGLFGKQVLKVAMEASRYGRKSLATTVRAMLRERFLPASCYNYVHDSYFEGLRIPLVEPAIADGHNLKRYLHPLLMPDDGALKGKYQHILMCALMSLEYYDHWDTEYFAPREHIYLTQPIIEACLRIPTWVMTFGGVDRGLARRAFHNDLPRDVVGRLSKSTPAEYYRDIYAHNIDHLRDVLLDGFMTRENLLLRDKLERVLNRDSLFIHVDPGDVLGYYAAEVWLRRWMDRPVRRERDIEIAV